MPIGEAEQAAVFLFGPRVRPTLFCERLAECQHLAITFVAKDLAQGDQAEGLRRRWHLWRLRTRRCRGVRHPAPVDLVQSFFYGAGRVAVLTSRSSELLMALAFGERTPGSRAGPCKGPGADASRGTSIYTLGARAGGGRISGNGATRLARRVERPRSSEEEATTTRAVGARLGEWGWTDGGCGARGDLRWRPGGGLTARHGPPRARVVMTSAPACLSLLGGVSRHLRPRPRPRRRRWAWMRRGGAGARRRRACGRGRGPRRRGGRPRRRRGR